MARVDNNQVQNIVGDTEVVDFTEQIDVANVVVDDNLVGRGLSDNLLEKIELYLAAHYVAMTDPGLSLSSQTQGEAIYLLYY